MAHDVNGHVVVLCKTI